MSLKDNLMDLLMNFDMDFTNEEENVLKKAPSDEK